MLQKNFDGTTTAGSSSVYRRSLISPADEQSTSGFSPTPDQYRFWWNLYSNTQFDDALSWFAYKQKYRLYRNTRSIYNPMTRLVDFYAGTVYGGVLTDDALSMPNGAACAVPIDPNTPEELRLAISQVWRWSNFQAQKSVLVRYGAALGDVFIETVEDLEREKVWLQVWWPGFIDDLEVSSQGNVQKFALEYIVTPADRRRRQGQAYEKTYLYRKEVDREGIRTYKDDVPFAYPDSPGDEWAHDLGFCPGAWIKHRDYGGDHGANAWESSQAKLEELNALASRIHDQIHKIVASPVIFWTDTKISSLTKKSGPDADGDEVRHPDAQRDEVMVLKGPSEGRKENLVGDLNLADAQVAMDRVLKEIESDHPELVMWRELRDMSQITGPAARRLIGDTLPRIGEPAANYDRGLMACHGQTVAIAGQRLADGDWQHPTKQQQLFDGFDLESYAKGELDHNVMPRPLIDDTEDERIARAEAKMRLGIDLETIWEGIGIDADSIAMIRTRKAAEDRANIERQAAMFSSGETRGAFGGGPFDGDVE